MPVAPLVNFTPQMEPQEGFSLETDGNETLPEYGGTLRICLELSVVDPYATLNPLLPSSHPTYVPNSFLWQSIFSFLVRLDANNSVSTDLAESWVISADGLNYTFFLYENITWHDGYPFSASDVMYTFETILGNPSVDSKWKTWVGPLLTVSIIDTHVVSLILEEVFPAFLSYLVDVPVIPRHLYNETDIGTNPYNVYPIGTGPFKFVTWNPEKNMTLQSNSEYHKGRPFLDYVFFRWDVSVEDYADYLTSNIVDLVFWQTDPQRIDELMNVPGITLFIREMPAVRWMAFNFTNTALAGYSVRNAIAYAINRTEICEISHFGYAEPAVGPLSSMYAPWHNQNLVSVDYNKTMAELLLNQSGWMRDPETGWRFSLILKVSNVDQLRVNASRMIADYLAEVGIHVVLEVTSNPYDMYQNFDLGVHGTLWESTDPLYTLRLLWHSAGAFNFQHYSNGTLDLLFDEGMITVNTTRRKEIYDEVQNIIVGDFASLFLYWRKLVTGYNNDFHDLISKNMIFSIDAFSLEKAWYNPTLSGQGKSPVKVCFVDQEGKRTGFYEGSVVKEIPGSSYDEEANVVKIRSPPETRITVRNPGDPYREIVIVEPSCFMVEVVGTGTGHYRLELVNVALEYKSVVIVECDTYEGKVDQYWLVVYKDGLIYQKSCPAPLQITYGFGHQMVVPADGVYPKAYDTKQSKTYIPE